MGFVPARDGNRKLKDGPGTPSFFCRVAKPTERHHHPPALNAARGLVCFISGQAASRSWTFYKASRAFSRSESRRMYRSVGFVGTPFLARLKGPKGSFETHICCGFIGLDTEGQEVPRFRELSSFSLQKGLKGDGHVC